MRPLALLLLTASAVGLLVGCATATPTRTRENPPAHRSRFVQRLEQGRHQQVVVFGTSLSQGGAWVPQLQDALEARFPGLVTITNTAKGGESSEWGRAQVETHVIAHHPDVVFIEFAINDAVARFDLSPERVRENVEFMLDRISTALPDCEVILQIMNPVVGKPEGDFSYRRDQPGYQQIYRDAAARRGLLLIDHSPTWSELLRTEGEQGFKRYAPDGVHPNAEAYARFVTPVILKALFGTDGPPPRRP